MFRSRDNYHQAALLFLAKITFLKTLNYLFPK